MPTKESANEEYIANRNTGSKEEQQSKKKKSGEGEAANIAGCSFSVYPLDNHYVQLIQSALEMVDMSKVWSKTDDISTTVRGPLAQVFDVSKAVFMHAAKTGKHVTLRATYSIGCPGDNKGEAYMSQDAEPANASSLEGLNQESSVKFALYPMGEKDYMELINKQIKALEQKVKVSRSHYETRLDGDAHKIFQGLERAFRETNEAGSPHTVMTVAMVAHNQSTP